MKINIIKCGLASATVVVCLMGVFSGCTQGSSDPYDMTASSSSAVPASSDAPYVPPTKPTLVSPIRFSNFSVITNSEQSTFKFQGNISLDVWDTLANAESANDPYFTAILLELARIDENGEKKETPLNSFFTYNEGTFPRYQNINLVEMDAKIEDPNKTECGTYRLYVYAYATNDALGDPDYLAERYRSIDSLDFVRDAQACVVIPVESSSSEALIPAIELVKGEGSFSNLANSAFSFVTGQEATPAEGNITFTVSDQDEITIHAINNYTVTQYTNNTDKNYDDDWSIYELPPEPAHMNNFRFNQASLGTEQKGLDNEKFFIVIGPNYNQETGDDFYAFTLKEAGNRDANGTMKITIIFYKKK